MGQHKESKLAGSTVEIIHIEDLLPTQNVKGGKGKVIFGTGKTSERNKISKEIG